MKLFRTLVAAAFATMLATAANAAVFVLTGVNADGNAVSATAEITAVGDHVTLTVTNGTQGMFAANQAISDILLNFTTNVGGVSNFTQSGQRATINADGSVTLIAGDPTRWDPSNPNGDTYLDVLGGGQPSEMIASNSLGIPNGSIGNFNPYILGTATFTFDLANASLLQLLGLQFSFGTNHEFKAYGNCISGCGSINLLSGVPEPATWAMMIVGIGMVGAMLRRQRAQRRLAHS